MSSFKLSSPPLVNPDDLSLNSSTQEMDLGAKVYGNDGTAYRYVKAGATALVPGKLYDGPANVANHTNIVAGAAAAAGATSVTVTLGATAATANQYAGGKLVVNDSTGEGFTYHIESHPAADASADLVITLSENTPIITALVADTSEVTLIPNQYNGVIIHAATETGVPVGVAVYAVTAAYYGWVQVEGPCAVLQDASYGGVGEGVSASATTAGACTTQTGALKCIGTNLAAGVSGEYNPVHLTIG